MRTLHELAIKYPTDKLSHHFIDIYADIFESLMDKPIRLLEIGIYHGNSLRLWRDYFINGLIHGIDIDNKYLFFGNRIICEKADQSNRDDLSRLIIKIGGAFDIIIDDGSHIMHDQQLSFGYLFQHLKHGGFYIIEDLHSCYLHPSHYGQKEDGSNWTLNVLQDFIDTNSIKSEYMLLHEIDSINAYASRCTIHRISDDSIIAIIAKS